MFAKDSLYRIAFANIKNAFALDMPEHCISFGKSRANNILSFLLSNGAAISGKVPAIANAFTDLHNHPNNLPPDAGDFYGFIDNNKTNPDYKTRLLETPKCVCFADNQCFKGTCIY